MAKKDGKRDRGLKGAAREIAERYMYPGSKRGSKRAADPAQCRHNEDPFMCEENGPDVNYTCNPAAGAFGCGSTEEDQVYNCDNFTCGGGVWDDFECYGQNQFTCGLFECTYSFDDEDCENAFECEPVGAFTCGGDGGEAYSGEVAPEPEPEPEPEPDPEPEPEPPDVIG